MLRSSVVMAAVQSETPLQRTCNGFTVARGWAQTFDERER
jgi:hypothetical protein